MKKSKKKLKEPKRLTDQALKVLSFVWKWKVVSFPAIKRATLSKKSFWTCYRVVRNLVDNGLLAVVNAGSKSEPHLFQLTKEGFKLVNDRLKYELSENRFQAQSVVHDSINSAFHLGEFISGVPENVQLLSEQELQCLDPGLYPDGIPKSKEHIPDGFTIVTKESEPNAILAIEVEIKAKPLIRYDKVGLYYDMSPDVMAVLWLVGSPKTFSDISHRFLAIKVRRMMIHNFVYLDHFKSKGWQAEVVFGSYKGMSIKDIMSAIGVQLPCNLLATHLQPDPVELLLSPMKSPKTFST